jgi:hypothetical protein
VEHELEVRAIECRFDGRLGGVIWKIERRVDDRRKNEPADASTLSGATMFKPN